MGVENLFQNSYEVIIRELKFILKIGRKINTKNKRKLSCTMSLAKYGSLALYDKDLEKYSSDHEKLQVDKKYGCTLIANPK